MHIRTIIISLIVLATAALAALNWGGLSAPSTITFGVTTMEAPLGLIMLGLTTALVAVFVAYVVYLHSSVMLEARRHNKEMSAQRELADKAEASRFTELRNYLDTQRQQTTAADTQAHTALLARLEQLEKTLAQQRTAWPPMWVSWKTGWSAKTWFKTYLVARIHVASFLASAGLTWALAGIGTGPQTPEPPLMILAASMSAASFCLAYLAATSLKDGPTTFLSTAWQAMQFLAVAKAWSAKAGVERVKAAKAVIRNCFIVKFPCIRLHCWSVIVGFRLRRQNLGVFGAPGE